jgi:hypothetical protein
LLAARTEQHESDTGEGDEASELHDHLDLENGLILGQ